MSAGPLMLPWSAASWMLDNGRRIQEARDVAVDIRDTHLEVLRDGVWGASNNAERGWLTLRLAKTVSLGGSVEAKIYEEYEGGPAMIKLTTRAEGSVGRGAAVEYNIGDTPTIKKAPGTGDRRFTSVFVEAIGRTHRITLDYRSEYTFENRQQAERFLQDFERNRPGYVRLALDHVIVGSFDQAYRNYTRARGAETGASGNDYYLHWSPAALKAYGSVASGSLKAIIEKQFPGLRLPPPGTRLGNTLDFLTWGIAAYGEAGGSLDFAAGYTADDPESSKLTLLTDDLNPGAPGAFILQGQFDYRAFGALSIGPWAPVAGLREDTHLGGTALIFDRHHNWRQTVIAYESHGARLTPEVSQYFRDFRLNDLQANDSWQALYADLRSDRAMAKIELRFNRAGGHVETLLDEYRARLDNAGPHDRFAAIRADDPAVRKLFEDKWEKPARNAYENTVNNGPLSDQEWNRILHQELTPTWNGLPPWPWSKPARQWRSNFITPAHQQAYAKWQDIAARRLAERRVALENMSGPELYQAYQDAGLRYPAVYIGIYEGQKREIAMGLGRSNADFGGLRQLRFGREQNHYRMIGGFAVSHDAWPRVTEILRDPLAGPAFLALMNRSAYPRSDAQGNRLSPAPAAALVYHGTIPTHRIHDLETASGHPRDLRHIPGIHTVGAGERRFEDIAARALERITGRTASPGDIAAYARAIQDINFPGVPSPEDYIFAGAHIILPTPR